MNPRRARTDGRELTAEEIRLAEDARRARNWKRWGPYLSERQWGTVREDYSASGDSWDYLPHDHARSRAYRWGEDGLLGVCDREGRLAFAIALWNGKDPILKERLFGLSGPEGNHGEDVKEAYFYLDSTPTHSYMKALYRYPLDEFPYARLLEENRRRGLDEREFELADTGVFDDGRYADVLVEYAKASPDDLLIRVTVTNRSRGTAGLHVLPTLWLRNTWSWGRSGEGYPPRPALSAQPDRTVLAEHRTLGRFRLAAGPGPGGVAPPWLFTENETNRERLWGIPNASPYVKDAFHEYVIHGRAEAVNPLGRGTRAAACYRLELAGGAAATLELRLWGEGEAPPKAFGDRFARTFDERRQEADAFYAARLPAAATPEEREVLRQGYAGLLWSKQFYYYVVRDWLAGDPTQPPPPPERAEGRNSSWVHLYNRDVLSMPDTWEYPWYAAWDLAFHTIPFATVDPDFAKQQLLLLLREWYMHPNGQLPAYEFGLDEVNPPVHAWACWRVYKMTGRRGERDRLFLDRAFHKLTLNFTWWVNREDQEGKNLFAGGFLGLDNVGVFDRSRPLPMGGNLEQADGTAWMAFYCATMLAMALELAKEDPAYEDMASKFFEHFVTIADAMNHFGGSGLWDEEDGFYYDKLHVAGRHVPLRVRSVAGLVPLLAAEILEDEVIDRLPGFRRRMQWFLANRSDLGGQIAYASRSERLGHGHRLLAIPSRERLERVLRYLLDEGEFLSLFGVRSLSKWHELHPYVLVVNGEEHRVAYDPGEGSTRMFGGNSNWRGPVWFPVNYLLIEALERYDHFYGDGFRVECPTGSGRRLTLREVADEVARRLTRLFLPDAEGRRPCHGGDPRFRSDPAWRDLVLFHEYFDAETGRGLGASHQTGWTALVLRLLQDQARAREPGPEATRPRTGRRP
jgi:Mannosylglycerate hydrolase MGH1-like glycoside hydrolase domain